MTTTEPSKVRERTPAVRERPIDAASGWTAIAVSVLLILIGAAGIVFATVLGAALGIVLLVLGILFAILGLLGFAGLTPVIAYPIDWNTIAITIASATATSNNSKAFCTPGTNRTAATTPTC